MKRAFFFSAIPMLAIAGFAIAVFAVFNENGSVPSQTSADIAKAPYLSYIAGSGIVEAIPGNVAIGTPVAGIVTDIYAQWGQQLSAGQPLFKIDDSDLQARLPTAKAKVAEAEANLAKSKYLAQIATHLHDTATGAISEKDYHSARFDAERDQAALDERKAEVEEINSEIERHVIRAPSDGSVLQINTRVGEFADSSATGTPLMVFGDDSRLYVRGDINENDAWRFQPQSAAKAFLRARPEFNTDLKFERIEPLMAAKTSLSGDSTERTDTRVLQVIYSFARTAMPAYVGQQVDVFIEAKPVERVVPPASGKP